MFVRGSRFAFCLSAAAAWSAVSTAGAQVPNPPAPPGAAAAAPLPPNGQNAMQVLDQGPIHEAFAELPALDPLATPIIERDPPEPINELPPEVRPEGENIEWIPGYWMWSDEKQDFIWVSGVWRDVPPGRRWIPGHWMKVAGGFQWISGFWAGADAQGLNLLPAPPESLEEGPASPAPAANYFWIPGCWIWNNGAYAWRAGYWYAGQPNWIWIPDHYCYTPQGVIFVSGYWDYLLVRRGLIFAPVWWSRPVWQTAGWHYRPYCAIDSGLLLSTLFVNRRCHHYYFGHGHWRRHDDFHHWWEGHGRDRGYDPFCAYHRWHDGHGHDDWADHFRRDFQQFQQTAERSGRGRVHANNLVKNIDGARDRQIGDLKLRQVSQNDLLRSQRQIEQFNDLRTARVSAEEMFQQAHAGKPTFEELKSGQTHQALRDALLNGGRHDGASGDEAATDRLRRHVGSGVARGRLGEPRDIIVRGGRSLTDQLPTGNPSASDQTGNGERLTPPRRQFNGSGWPSFGAADGWQGKATLPPRQFEQAPNPLLERRFQGSATLPGGGSSNGLQIHRGGEASSAFRGSASGMELRRGNRPTPPVSSGAAGSRGMELRSFRGSAADLLPSGGSQPFMRNMPSGGQGTAPRRSGGGNSNAGSGRFLGRGEGNGGREHR